MTEKTDATETTRSDQFSRMASEAQTGFVREHLDFLRRSRKWFLLPILLALAVAGLVVVVGGSVAAPFIYALF